MTEREIHLRCDSCGTDDISTPYFVNHAEDITLCYKDAVEWQAPEVLDGMVLMFMLYSNPTVEAYKMYRWTGNVVIEDKKVNQKENQKENPRENHKEKDNLPSMRYVCPNCNQERDFENNTATDENDIYYSLKCSHCGKSYSPSHDSDELRERFVMKNKDRMSSLEQAFWKGQEDTP